MKRILSVLLLVSSFVSYSQIDKYCLSLDDINDTLIAVSSQFDSDLRREYLIFNPINKKVYYQFVSEDAVCFIGSKIISYRNQNDDISKAPSSIFYSYDIYTNEIKQTEFPFSVIFFKVSSKDSEKLFLYTSNKNESHTIYLDKNLILSDKIASTISCSIVFGRYVDTVGCSENFDYNKIYYKNVHSRTKTPFLTSY